ncbi:MAG: hypothetical protein ABIJ09_01865 [Pseudomonadota bacterium]
MRVRAPWMLLLVGTLMATGCTDPPLEGECVPGFDYTDKPSIFPSVSPFIMCPVSPVAPNNKINANFLLNNCGRQPLTIESAAISNAAAPEVFGNLQLEKTDVNPGDSAAALFVYTAVDTLEHRGTITVKSNADNFPELTIDVVVRADEPFDGGFCPPVQGGGTDAGAEDI